MIHFKFSDKDPRWVFLKGDTDTDTKCLKMLQKEVNLVNPICYLPTYKGIPFTEDVLWDIKKSDGTIVFYSCIGMWQVYYKYFKEYGWEFDGLDKKWFKNPVKHSLEEFKAIVDSWGLLYKPRPYQYEAAYKILQWKQSVSQLATRAGKTLTAYIIFRYAMEHMGVKKILMIVPSIELVKQAYSDFSDYKEFFKTECIWGGGKLVESSNLTVGTYQSLIKFLDRKSAKYNPSFFNGYDLVFVDETHKATANQIKTLISQPFMLGVKLAFGMTGTVPKDHTIERYCLHSLLGAKIQEILPKDLQDQGYLAPVKIIQCRLHYKDKMDQLKKWIRCAEYSIGDDVTYREEVHTGKIYPEPVMKDMPARKKKEEDEEYEARCEAVRSKFKKKHDAWIEHCKKVEESAHYVIKKVKLDKPEFLIQNVKHFPDGLNELRRRAFDNPTEESLLKYKKLLEKAVVSSTKASLHHVEIMMNHFFEQRIDYIIEKLRECPNNTLILAQHREYIKHMHARIKEAFPDRPVLFVIGGSKDQKVCKKILKENDNCILIAGYAIMGTGVTLSNLAYEILAESVKSEILNTQSLGRTLGLAKPEGVDRATIYDITDCYSQKYASSKILAQGKERIKIYNKNEFPVEIVDVDV